MQALKVRKVGNSVGVILPKETLDAMHIKEGDTLYISTSAEGIQLAPYDPEFAVAMKAFEKSRRKYRNALRELAK